MPNGMMNKNNFFNMIFEESYSLHDGQCSEIEKKNNLKIVIQFFQTFKSISISFWLIVIHFFFSLYCNICFSFLKVFPF